MNGPGNRQSTHATRVAHAPGVAAAPVAGKDRFQTFEAAHQFLLDRVNVEASAPAGIGTHAFKLGRMTALMAALGDPHRTFKSVHVAGSKGKGSVCEMTASCLSACGLTTGLYTSPHLVDVRERIRIGSAMISHDEFRRLAERAGAAIPAIADDWGEPTFFELMTAMAFLHFAEQAVDVAVIEVGLGGRLDSTNVLRPMVSAITAIQLEHTDLLGTTLGAIAREKAGIIKQGVPVVCVDQPSTEVVDVLREVAAAHASRLRFVGRDIEFSSRIESCQELGQHARVCLTGAHTAFEHLPVPLKGEHQAMNCGLVLAILDEVKGAGFRIGEREVAQGLSRTPTHGRMELVHADPRIFVDGAHNPESIGCLLKALGSHVRYDNLVVVFGCAKDKDIPGMLSRIASGADKVIFTRATGNARAAEPRDLLRRFADASGQSGQTAPTVKEALNLAARAVGRDDIICVTGSFYIAGEAKRLLQEKFGPCGCVASDSCASQVPPPSVGLHMPIREVKPERGAREGL